MHKPNIDNHSNLHVGLHAALLCQCNINIYVIDIQCPHHYLAYALYRLDTLDFHVALHPTCTSCNAAPKDSASASTNRPVLQ